MDINLPIAPPVNNNIQTTLFDKLDQVAFEKIRVANSQLDTRLTIQEKIINKYRKDVEKVHAQQTQRLRREVKKIRQKKPDYVFDDSDISTQSRSRATADVGRQRCQSEPPKLSYCRRFYSHHYNLKDDTKKDKDDKHEKKETNRDFFNLGFRLYFLNMMHAQERNKLSSVGPDDLGKSLDSSFTRSPDFGTSLSKCARDRITTQSSTDESELDDVFDLSHSSFRTEMDGLKHKGSVDCLTEISEATNPTSNDEMASEKEAKRKRRRDSNGNRRRSSKASSADLENYGLGLRKSKRAFEKIFSGLL